MMRTAAFVLCSLLGARSALACSCIGPTPVCSVYWNTAVLFLGHVVRIEHVSDQPSEKRLANGKTIALFGPGQNLVHFDVTKSYRGAPGEKAVIHTSDQGSACGFEFEPGHDYLVYAVTDPNGEFSTGRCTRTHEVTGRADDADIQWIEGLSKAAAGAAIYGKIQRQRPNDLGGYDADSLAGIEITVAGAESKTATSDADGKFRVDGLAPGKYSVFATAPAQYAPFPNSAVTVQDRGCAEVDFSTRLDGHIRGHLYFSDGTPAADVYLTAKIADSNPHEPWTWQASYTMTASDGSFDFTRLAPGSYVFAANMDFSPGTSKGTTYYRKAFFPGVAHRSEASVIPVDAGQMVDHLRFFLPPDAGPPAIPLEVTVVGFDGNPVPHAQVLAYDDMWENSVTPAMADADEHGKATIALRSGQYYDVEAVVNLPDLSQACAVPLGVDVREHPTPLVLALTHPIGNCTQFKKPRNGAAVPALASAP
jgi:protocatechuate 3,4-dioxygenase beta subunit